MSSNTIIISAFPCCGKTHAYENYKSDNSLTILDSDSSKFSWILDENGDSTGERNPEFPQNYIQHIQDNIGKADIIFVSSHSEVRSALLNAGIKFGAIIPQKDCRSEWVGRAYLRGSSISFINTLMNCWTSWLEEYEDTNIGYPVIRLGKYDYIDVCEILHGASFNELRRIAYD